MTPEQLITELVRRTNTLLAQHTTPSLEPASKDASTTKRTDPFVG